MSPHGALLLFELFKGRFQAISSLPYDLARLPGVLLGSKARLSLLYKKLSVAWLGLKCRS